MLNVNPERLRQIRVALVKEAKETATHKRLRGVLANLATDYGYQEELSQLPSGKRPDVLRYVREPGLLFVGDAKNSVNEPPSNRATLSRIASYVSEFAHLLGSPDVNGGLIAIATDGEQAARDWVVVLNTLASINDIVAGDGGDPDFQVFPVDPQTWVTYW